MVFVKSAQKKVCHDCQVEIKTKNNEILNGFELVYDLGGEKIKAFKCKQCFAKDKSLKNYQSCEVYSRIVGYLRPVDQWNEGKREEYKKRKEYNLS